MLQGTCSNAGKSLLTAGLCRLFTRRGYNVAPFKAQNMSLNSFVTPDGGEMGRAQALQAQACGLVPDVRMNPVLLKPTGDTGSQVLLLGQPHGQIQACDYMRARRRLWRTVTRSYAELARGRDIMLIEGAGSPAEINLRTCDIVNMRMARFARATVLLVADIDRGGAFAALVGTLTLLTPRERACVGGLVLNKFRGDETLLAPAMETISRKTAKPFVGTVPWLQGLALPDEDSVSIKQARVGMSPPRDRLDVAFIDMPRISNATDLDALAAEPDVCLRPVRDAGTLGRPDCLVLPGTRNTMADMRHLHENGLADAICAYARVAQVTGHGCLVGICGGLQMLGSRIDDPLGLEDGGSVEGLSLLPINTVLAREKILRQTRGVALPPLTDTPIAVAGYEIHHGQSTVACEDGKCQTLLQADTGEALGFGIMGADGVRVLGSYLHGLFDSDSFRHAFCQFLRKKRGLSTRPPVRHNVEPALDALANSLEEHLDIQKILGLCRLPPTRANAK